MLGSTQMTRKMGEKRDVPQTPITIVQPNIDQGDKWDMEQRRANFTKLARLSPPKSADAEPRLLLWPEAAVPDYLEGGYPIDWYLEPASFVRARLAALLGPDDLLLTGAVRLESNAARTDVAGARNSVFTLNAQQQLGPRYDKAHLVPYGEYLPMRSILEPLGLSRLAPGAVDFWPGPGPRTLDLGRFGKVGVQICYEIIFSGQVVDRANRPAFLFNPSNDAWFGSWGPPQHLAQARMRAIEEGLPVIRSTPTGISAIIDADGRIIESIPMHRAGRIDGYVPAAHRPTPFAHYGNILPLLFAGLLLAIGLMPLARRRAKG
jgi:apolipoprotein N-acyltransferase